jgi:hypothetical protein
MLMSFLYITSQNQSFIKIPQTLSFKHTHTWLSLHNYSMRHESREKIGVKKIIFIDCKIKVEFWWTCVPWKRWVLEIFGRKSTFYNILGEGEKREEKSNCDL